MSADSVFSEIFLNVGAVLKKDRDGRYWEMEVNQFVIHLEPFIRQNSRLANSWLGLECSVAHCEFSKLANLITADPPSSFMPISWFQKSLDVSSTESLQSAAHALLESCLQDVRSCNIESLIDTYILERPDRPSMKQILHLAALSWRADRATLEAYVEAFERGNHLNFVPMITRQMIEKAIAVLRESKVC
jgi:hypothetical protein